MAALSRLVLERQDPLLGAEVERVAVHLEARDHLRAGGVGQQRIEDVDPLAEREVRRELEAQQAVLLALRDRDRSRGGRLLRARLPDLEPSVALDVEHAPVGGHVELHRVLRVVVQRDLLEVRGDRRLCRRCAAPPENDQQRRRACGQRLPEPTHSSLLS
jgi:hypothetical protein